MGNSEAKPKAASDGHAGAAPPCMSHPVFSSAGAKPCASDGAAPPSLTDPVGGSAGAKPRASDGAAPSSLTDPVGGSAGAKARASDGAAPPSLTDPVGASARANSPTAPSSSDAPCSKNLAASAGNGETTKPPEYPRRSGVADCSYYVKFGTCGHGMKCWFNHPDLPATGGGGQSQASNPSEHNKKYFSRKACNYNRHEGKKQVEQVKMNFLGLPLRPGAGLCSHYMQRGTCKFGTNCKFHHPDPTSEHANSNASPRDVQESSQVNFSSEPMQPAQNEQSLPLVTSQTSRTSKIIRTQGDSTCTERSAYEMDENKQGKDNWDAFATKVFCDICTVEVLAGNRPNDHLNAIWYKNLCAKLNLITKKGYNHEQFKSKWESLKKDYQTWTALMESEDDQGRCPKMNKLISASPEWWAKKKKAMPDCGKFRSAPLQNVDLLKIMFEDMLDSTTPDEANLAVSTTMGREHGAGDGNDIGIIDKQVNEQSKEAILTKSSKEEHNSTKPETSCTHAEINHIVNSDENLIPKNSPTSTRVVDQVGSNISEVMELVVDAGVEEGSDEHFIATQLFVRPEFREMFLTLQTPRGRLGWLKKMCQVKE